MKKKLKPYLIFAGTLFVILAVYKTLIQPNVPASLQKYTPTV